ncbi:pyridoxal 5'-phosphate synthase glutaminase subunit PdxT [Candidatus Protochlamydia sp. R18]|uniref:pyridoxal 5'-phosphate synthase glutaminase subunit PdxT n=1 Tax=Candidatus Protochlamydia sp. R18 TaxID=1353977 RepID=UPI0005A664EB|nr:pyridoxal 5'-phosphate synthase glutaminase subunit PdxT [Candidatus Protochlamydia sp. R18]
MLIGILALQGDFFKHQEMLHSLGIETIQVKTRNELDFCDALIIPGGESTVMMRQLETTNLKELLVHFAIHKPVFGTCAGLILMSSHVQNSAMMPLGLLHITVERNAFGRQVDSFQVDVSVYLKPGDEICFPAFFIRAPRIRTSETPVQILASYEEEPILVRQGHHLGASFHPELTVNPSIHLYFLEMVKENLENYKK